MYSQMDEEVPHQRALRECFVYLVENVRARDVMDHLFAGGALTLDDMEEIEQKGGDRMKTRELIKKLIQKPESAFHILLDALRETATDHVVEELTKKLKTTKQEQCQQKEDRNQCKYPTNIHGT